MYTCWKGLPADTSMLGELITIIAKTEQDLFDEQ